MSTQNFFALLGDDENEDPIAAIERASSPAVAATSAAASKKQQQQTTAAAKLPSKPLPPAEAVKDGRGYENSNNTNNYNTRGGRGGRGARGGARGGYADREGGGFRDRDSGFSREFVPRDRPNYGGERNSNFTRNGGEPTEGGYQGGRGGGGGGYYGGGDRAPRGEDGEVRSYDGSRGRGRGRGRDRGFGGVDGEERPRRREFDRHSGSGRGTELKRDGAGRGNWGTDGDQVSVFTEPIEPVKDEKSPPELEDKKVETDFAPESAVAVVVEDGEEKKEEEEDNEMTLDEYEKILEEKKKALGVNKAEERKVKVDKDFESMLLVEKKNDEDFFIKLGSDKDKGKKKEAGEKEEKAKKAVSINEFLKPADGERYYGAGGRGRGRGRGRGEDRGGFRGGFAGSFNNARRGSAPRIEDPAQFPTLGAK